jgi:uncharacterized membrane protein YfcA
VPELPLWKWLLGAACAFSIGVAKTGVPGLGILAVPLFVVTVGDARLSAAWLLPLLIAADCYAVIVYRKKAAANALFSLLPWVMAGMAAGAAVLVYPDAVIRPLVGSITLAMLLLFLWRLRFATGAPPAGWWFSGFFGTSAGFATMVANAAGPIMNIYLLSRRLSREEFVATGAWFFFFINLTKVPVYAYHGLFSVPGLLFDSVLLLPTLAGAMVGRKLISRIPEKVFLTAVIVLAFLATILLFLPARR